MKQIRLSSPVKARENVLSNQQIDAVTRSNALVAQSVSEESATSTSRRSPRFCIRPSTVL